MTNYQIACIFSVLTAICTAMSAWVPSQEKSFLLQTLQCLLYAIASVFFGVYSTVVTVLFCALRNFLVAKDRFNLKACIPLTVLLLVLGLAFNNAGFIGLVPVATTLIYNVCCLLMKSLILGKWNIFVNLLLWAFYDFLIRDYVSLCMDMIGVVTTVAAIIRITGLIRRGELSPDARELTR